MAPSFSSSGWAASGWATFRPSRASVRCRAAASSSPPPGSGSSTCRGPIVVRTPPPPPGPWPAVPASGTGSPLSRSGSTPARRRRAATTSRAPFQPGQPVDHLAQRHPGHTQRPQLRTAFEPGGQQAREAARPAPRRSPRPRPPPPRRHRAQHEAVHAAVVLVPLVRRRPRARPAGRRARPRSAGTHPRQQLQDRRRSSPSSSPLPSGPGTRSMVPTVTGRQSPSSPAYASAARSTRKSVSGPGATCRRVGSSGNEAISSAGSPERLVAWASARAPPARSAAGPVRPRRPPAPPRSPTSAGRSRSSTGRSASSAGSSGPPSLGHPPRGWRRARCPRSVTYGPSWLPPQRPVRRSGVSTTTSASPGRASSSASSIAGSSRSARSCGRAVAQRQHDGGVVALGRRALGGQRQPQQRHVAVAAAQLVAQPGAVRRRPPRASSRPRRATSGRRRDGPRRRARR